MRILGLIPARGGSKGVLGKNIRTVYGKPLLSYTIDAATASGVFADIVVSSDDDAILNVALSHSGVRVLRRPVDLGQDTTPVNAVIRQVLDQLEAEGAARYDAIMLLQATAPMREPQHICEAAAKLTPSINAVISVCAMHDVHPARMYHLGGDGLLAPMMPEWEQARRQDIPPAYYRNGSIYLVRRTAFDDCGAIMAQPTAAYVMSDRYLLNIDEPRDMILAEALIAAWKEGRL